MTKYFFIFFFLFNFLILNCNAQRSASEEIKFARYLIDNEQYRDAIFILKKISPTTDSINYFLGWSYYNLKVLDSSSIFFDKVQNGALKQRSEFYSAFNSAYLKKTAEAKNAFLKIEIKNDSSLEKLRNLQFAGIALLERNYIKFDSCARKFSYNYFPLQSEEKKFLNYKTQLMKVKKKSPLLAGTLSAIIPGSGKFYAGYKGQAFAALITVGILGISAAECYYKKGIKSPEFITFGSLFTIFYIGNIWGSTLSVKLAREHQLREIDDEILFDMHIPLRRVFN